MQPFVYGRIYLQPKGSASSVVTAPSLLPSSSYALSSSFPDVGCAPSGPGIRRAAHPRKRDVSLNQPSTGSPIHPVALRLDSHCLLCFYRLIQQVVHHATISVSPSCQYGSHQRLSRSLEEMVHHRAPPRSHQEWRRQDRHILQGTAQSHNWRSSHLWTPIPSHLRHNLRCSHHNTQLLAVPHNITNLHRRRRS